MKKNKSKNFIIFALIIAVVSVSLGFAAYSNTLTIKAIADVSPCAGCGGSIEFSSSPTQTLYNPITPTVVGATADAATLTIDGIDDISVHFTAPGQSATYTFYARNQMQFVGYLNSVTFGTKTCTPGEGTTAAYAANACNDIVMVVAAGTDYFVETENNVYNHSISSNSYEPINVTIEYIDGGATADGPLTVNFGSTSLRYSTVN